MRGHADAATLAAFREELLSARKAARVSAHLAACPRCAALDAQLAEVTTMLHRATAPPMPDALTARIQAALATEAAARAVDAPRAMDAPPLAAAAAGAGAATPGTPGRNGSQGPAGQDRTREQPGRRTGWRGHDRSWLALRVAAVTAAVAVIAGGGYGVAQLLTGSPAVNGTASRAAPGGARPRTSGSRARCHACPPAVSIRRQAPARRQRWYLRAPGDQQRHELPARNPGRPSQHRPGATEPPATLIRKAQAPPWPPRKTRQASSPTCKPA